MVMHTVPMFNDRDHLRIERGGPLLDSGGVIWPQAMILDTIQVIQLQVQGVVQLWFFVIIRESILIIKGRVVLAQIVSVTNLTNVLNIKGRIVLALKSLGTSRHAASARNRSDMCEGTCMKIIYHGIGHRIPLVGNAKRIMQCLGSLNDMLNSMVALVDNSVNSF